MTDLPELLNQLGLLIDELDPSSQGVLQSGLGSRSSALLTRIQARLELQFADPSSQAALAVVPLLRDLFNGLITNHRISDQNLSLARSFFDELGQHALASAL